MTEQGAAADNACREWSARRRRALRTGPRAPGPPPPSSDLGPGISARRSADRKAGLREVSQTSRRLPALHSPRLGKKENRDEGPAPGPEIKTAGQRSVG